LTAKIVSFARRSNKILRYEKAERSPCRETYIYQLRRNANQQIFNNGLITKLIAKLNDLRIPYGVANSADD